MVYQGTVQNGVVIFPNGIQPPEGSPVRVEIVPKEIEKSTSAEIDNADLDAVWRMGELAADTGISDLAVNINHYLYGHPKVDDGR